MRSTARRVRVDPVATTTTSVKIPAPTKAAVAVAAREAGLTVHAYLLSVIEQAVERSAARRAFVSAAQASLDGFDRRGLAHPAGSVRAYFKAKAAGKRPPRPKPSSWK